MSTANANLAMFLFYCMLTDIPVGRACTVPAIAAGKPKASSQFMLNGVVVGT